MGFTDAQEVQQLGEEHTPIRRGEEHTPAPCTVPRGAHSRESVQCGGPVVFSHDHTCHPGKPTQGKNALEQTWNPRWGRSQP